MTQSMTHTSSNYLMGVIAVVVASFLWGTTGTAATFAPDVSSLGIAAVSMGCGGLLQAVIAWRYIVRQWQALKQHRTLVLWGAVNVAIYPLAFYSSMRLSGVTIGTVVSIGMAPVAAAIIERLFDQQKLNTRWIMSIILGVFGVLLLASAKPQHSGSADMGSMSQWYNFFGILLGLIAAFTYAMYSWLAHRLIQRNVHSRAAMGSMFGVGGLLLFPVLLLTGAELLDSTTNLLVGVYMAAVPMFMGYLLFGYGLRSIRASLATIITLLEPVVAAILAMWIVGETLSWIGWAGIGLISSCLLIATLKRKPAPTPLPAAVDAPASV